MEGYNYLLVLLQGLIYEEWKRRVRDGCKHPSHINFLPQKPHQSRGGFFLFPFPSLMVLWNTLEGLSFFWGKEQEKIWKLKKKKKFPALPHMWLQLWKLRGKFWTCTANLLLLIWMDLEWKIKDEILHRGSGCICERQGTVYPFRKTRRWLHCPDAKSRTSANVHTCPHMLQLWLNNEEDVSFFLIFRSSYFTW